MNDWTQWKIIKNNQEIINKWFKTLKNDKDNEKQIKNAKSFKQIKNDLRIIEKRLNIMKNNSKSWKLMKNKFHCFMKILRSCWQWHFSNLVLFTFSFMAAGFMARLNAPKWAARPMILSGDGLLREEAKGLLASEFQLDEAHSKTWCACFCWCE